MTEREVRYCTTEDGVRIAYCVEGEGPPLVVVPFFMESFALEHLTPELRTFFQRLGEGRRLVRYDSRGTGLSQREIERFDIACYLKDLTAVVSAVGLKRFSIWTSTAGGQPAVKYAATHPKAIERLVLYGAYAYGAEVMSGAQLESLASLARSNWTMCAQTLADMGGRVEFAERLAHFGRLYAESSSGEVAARMLEEAYSQDVTDLLPEVRAHTLILHRLGDPIFPFTVARSMAERVQNARFVPLEGNAHLFCLGDFESVLKASRSFLDENGGRGFKGESLARVSLRTVLFTDLVGHTEMMSRLGDERGREVLREHERITREVLKAHGGTEVKTMGDGFMASFGSVTKAVECAVALQRAIGNWQSEIGERMAVRCGLNAGEPIEEEGDLFGATVILASRIAAKAEGGEILVADTVRGLCSGKGFLFADRGEFVAKGFEDPVRVYEVRWRED